MTELADRRAAAAAVLARASGQGGTPGQDFLKLRLCPRAPLHLMGGHGVGLGETEAGSLRLRGRADGGDEALADGVDCRVSPAQ